jgi:signal transduction histidine kinase
VGAEHFPSNPVLDRGLREALVEHTSDVVTYFAEYLDAESFGEATAGAALADYIRQRFQDRPIDLIIAMSDVPLQFALKYRDELFPNAPIVYMGVNRLSDTQRRAGAGATGVIVSRAYSETVRMALQMHPSTERVYVVATSPTRGNMNAVRNQLREFENRVELQYLEFANLAPLLAAVTSLPPRSLLLFVWFANLDDAMIYSDEIARRLAQVSSVPVYGSSDFYIGSGVVGGVVRVTHETGLRLGRLASQILNGARAEDLPIESARLVPILDWRAVERWNISPALLPRDAEIRFKVPTVWESYRGYIITALAILVGQLALITGLLIQRIRRQRAESTIREREATIRANYTRIRMLADQLLKAQEETRAEIARDLHDGVCQELAAISIALTSVKRAAPGTPELHRRVKSLQQQVHATYDELRRISHDLHPATLQVLGLGEALRSHCAEIEKAHAVRVTFLTHGEMSVVPVDARLSLFRIAQEAVRNAIAHGRTRTLEVSLIAGDDVIELVVRDQGVGFDVSSLGKMPAGLGIVSIEERARMLGGSARITSTPGRGTAVCVRLPIPDANARLVHSA